MPERKLSEFELLYPEQMPVIEKPEIQTSQRAPIARERTKVERICIVFLTLVAAVFLLRYAQAFILPFILALLLFYALDPVVSWLCRRGIPRTVSSLLLMAVLLAAGASSIYLLRGQANDMVDRLPEAMKKARAAIESQRNASGPVAKVQELAGELERTASRAAGAKPAQGVTRVQIEEPLFRASEYLWSGSLGVLWFLGQSITVIFLVFFLLASGDLYKRKLIEVVGPGLSRQKLTLEILKDIDQQIGRFLLIQIATSTLIGVAMGVSLWLLGVNQAAMWGVSAGILNSIPFFGTIIVTVGLALVAFLQFGTLEMVLTVAGITLFVTSIDGFLLTPLLTGRFSRMNNLAVFISLLFWGWLWGALGMLLAVPIMMAIKSICDHVETLQPIGHLLSETK
jgi:predicted PurR-regulated permease PerM